MVTKIVKVVIYMCAILFSLIIIVISVAGAIFLHMIKIEINKIDKVNLYEKIADFDISIVITNFDFNLNKFNIVMSKPSWIIIIPIVIICLIILFRIWLYINLYTARMLMYLRLGSTVLDEKGTYGTARWVNKTDISNALAENLLTFEPDIVLGSLINPNRSKKRNLSKYILYMGDAKRSNKHTAVIAPSGSGKTFSVVLPSIINIINKGASLLLTDPKGEIFESTSKFAEKNEYETILINFISMNNSMRFNIFEYIENEIDVSLITSIILENTELKEGESSSNPFWERAETSLLKAIILYMYHYMDSPNLPKLFDFIINNTNEELDMLFTRLPENDPCKMAFGIYLSAPKEIRGNIKIGLASRLDILLMSEIRQLTSTNDFDVRDLKNKKTAIYLMIPDTHNAYKFLINLFLSITCVKVIEYTDKNKTNKKITNQEIYAFLDEFKNIVNIPDFLKKLATYRSRKFHLIPVIQDIGQLKELYPNSWNTFLGNCSTKIILGAGDTETATWVSDYLGEAPIKEQTKMKEGGFFNLSKTKHINMKDAKRKLLNPDEVINLDEDEIIVIKKGIRPMKIFMVPLYTYKKEYQYMNSHKVDPYQYLNPYTINKQDIELINNSIVKM